MTPEEQAAADAAAAAAARAETERVSAAAAELARRKAAAAAEADDSTAPCRMADLADVRAELRADLDALKRAGNVPHGVSPSTPAPAQRRSGTVLGGVVGAVVVVVLLVVAGAIMRARGARE